MGCFTNIQVVEKAISLHCVEVVLDHRVDLMESPSTGHLDELDDEASISSEGCLDDAWRPRNNPSPSLRSVR